MGDDIAGGSKECGDICPNDLDEALNELGVLSAVPETRCIKKWSRRHPLRREKEQEISWCSSSSSSGSSFGSSSRRSSSSSSGSFSSLSYSRSAYSRSSVASSSISETPTGKGPGLIGSSTSGYQSTGSFSSSTSSLCSSLDLEPGGAPSGGYGGPAALKTNYPKVIRRLRSKPYALSKPRRYSLQLGVHKEEQGTSNSPHEFSIAYNRGHNLSDSEASSGSGTGTPPPGNSESGATNRAKRPFQLNFKEVKSNPSSPIKVPFGGFPGFASLSTGLQQHHTQSSYLPTTCSEETQLLTATGHHHHPCGGAINLSGQPSQAFLTRSKSLDDLTVLLNLQEDADFRQHAMKYFPNFHNPTLLRQQLEGSGIAVDGSSPSSCDMFENVLQRIRRLEM